MMSYCVTMSELVGDRIVLLGVRGPFTFDEAMAYSAGKQKSSPHLKWQVRTISKEGK